MAEASKIHGYHLACTQPWCPNVGTEWTVECEEIQPGLITNHTANYRCTGCNHTPEVVGLVDARDPVIATANHDDD